MNGVKQLLTITLAACVLSACATAPLQPSLNIETPSPVDRAEATVDIDLEQPCDPLIQPSCDAPCDPLTQPSCLPPTTTTTVPDVPCDPLTQPSCLPPTTDPATTDSTPSG